VQWEIIGSLMASAAQEESSREGTVGRCGPSAQSNKSRKEPHQDSSKHIVYMN
jgi:hypothetical protein